MKMNVVFIHTYCANNIKTLEMFRWWLGIFSRFFWYHSHWSVCSVTCKKLWNFRPSILCTVFNNLQSQASAVWVQVFQWRQWFFLTLLYGQRIVLITKTASIHFDATYILIVHSKGDQSWVFLGRTDAKAETPIIWLPHVKSWLIGKDSDAERDWGQEEKGTTEDEMAGWYHWLNAYEFEWTLGVGDRQGGLACCDFMGSQIVGHDWGTELNWTS